MEWKQLISNKRFGQEHKHAERHDDRSEFKRDYDRLIFSSAFRRLQNKTQVFPLPGSIFVHNRLTHSLKWQVWVCRWAMISPATSSKSARS